jgi:hypothetical protein
MKIKVFCKHYNLFWEEHGILDCLMQGVIAIVKDFEDNNHWIKRSQCFINNTLR